MADSGASVGYFPNGVPYNRVGSGPRNLVVFQGLVFEHKPLTGLAALTTLSMYGFLRETFTTYVLAPRPGLPQGYTLGDIANDYAAVIERRFGQAVDVMGTSTGGSIAQHFAADHPELVRKLVLHATAHTLGREGKAAQLRVAHSAGEGRWRQASEAILALVFPGGGTARLMRWFAAHMMAFTAPRDPSDLIVTIQAEDVHAFRERLAEISAPTLVIDGADDRFYSEALLRETAAGIPNARLVLYPGKGHGAIGKAFQRDLLAFLLEG